MKCAQFTDTAASYSNHGASANLSIVGSLTICAWIKLKPCVFSVAPIIFLKGQAGQGYQFYIDKTSSPGRCRVAFTKLGVASDVSTVEIQPNRLTHVAVVFDSVAGRVYFYRDGVNVTNIVDGAAIVATAANGTISDSIYGSAYRFVGCVYELNVYNRALSDAEVLYNKEHPNNAIRRGRQLGVTQESWVGGVWKDLSPNGYDGTPTGVALSPYNNVAGRNSTV